MNYEQKYLKYKNKYLTLKKQIGGWKCLNCNTVNEESLTVCKSCAKKHSVGAPSGSVPSASLAQPFGQKSNDGANTPRFL